MGLSTFHLKDVFKVHSDYHTANSNFVYGDCLLILENNGKIAKTPFGGGS